MNYKIYRAAETSLVESYLVPIFDGTASMYHEYESAVSAYFDIFSNKRSGVNEFQFQFKENNVYDLLPFRFASFGNITKVFQTVFQLLLQNKNKLPNCLTILFIGDGQEDFDLIQLKGQIEIMKKNFSISFISLGVGNSFPLQISNELRKELHNQDPSIQSTFMIERNRKPKNIVRQDFKEKFLEIKKLLQVYEGKLTLNRNVKQTIISQPDIQVIPNSVFYTEEDVQLEYQNGNKLEPNQNEDNIVQLIISSVQQVMIESYDINVKEKMQQIKQVIQIILKSIPILDKNGFNQQNSKIVEILELIDDISEGNLRITALTEDQKTKIQEALLSDQRSLKEEIIKYVEVIKNPKVLNQGNLNNRISEKYKQIKIECFTNGQKQQLSKLEQAELIMRETLKNCIQVMENDQQVDFVQLLSDFKNQTFISLNKVFQESDFKIESYEQINLLKQMNDLFELIQKVIIKQLNLSDFISTIQAKYNQKQSGNIQQSVNTSAAIFNSNEDFNFLPAALRLLVKEEIDLEEAEKVFILLVDCNQSMEKESNLAIERFKFIFRNVPEDKSLSITWADKTFSIHINESNQHQFGIDQGKQFNTLFQCLEAVENYYNLKNRRLYICLVSDGETEYQILHNELKVAKFHYSVQFIYVAIGGKLFARIENELKQKYANKNVKGAPELLNIPRSLNVLKSNNQNIAEQLDQKFEALVQKVV